MLCKKKLSLVFAPCSRRNFVEQSKKSFVFLRKSSAFIIFLILHLVLAMNARPPASYELNTHLHSVFQVDRFNEIGTVQAFFDVSIKRISL